MALTKAQYRLLALAVERGRVQRRKGKESLFDSLVNTGYLEHTGKPTKAGATYFYDEADRDDN
jgi:hypothetical protein